MTQEEKILVDKYLGYKKEEEEARRNRLNALKELAALAPHKVGEVIKWTEQKRKNLGTSLHPEFVDLPPVEKKAIVTKVEACVWQWSESDVEFDYKYEFKPLKNGGGVSKNCCHPYKDYVWTGEVYDLNKE